MSANGDRLFRPNGQPSLSIGERRLLRNAATLLVDLDAARADLADAIAKDDVERCVIAARRFLGLGLLLGDFARDGVGA